jgi:hypothetical protein
MLHRCKPCFNSNKNKSEMEHRGFEPGSPRQEPSATRVRRTFDCESKGNRTFYILLLKRGPALKNTCVIHPLLFNPELNFVISISPS